MLVQKQSRTKQKTHQMAGVKGVHDRSQPAYLVMWPRSLGADSVRAPWGQVQSAAQQMPPVSTGGAVLGSSLKQEGQAELEWLFYSEFP